MRPTPRCSRLAFAALRRAAERDRWAASLPMQKHPMLFSGLISVMVFPALYSASPIDVAGIVMMHVMGVICFIPFAFFVRGVVRS
jgi:hypothetical protein